MCRTVCKVCGSEIFVLVEKKLICAMCGHVADVVVEQPRPPAGKNNKRKPRP